MKHDLWFFQVQEEVSSFDDLFSLLNKEILWLKIVKHFLLLFYFGFCLLEKDNYLPPQKPDCKCSACWSADLVRSGKQGQSFPSSFLMLRLSSSCTILSLGIRASCTQHSTVCPKQAETEQDAKSEDLSPLSVKTAWKRMLFHQWFCRKLPL